MLGKKPALFPRLRCAVPATLLLVTGCAPTLSATGSDGPSTHSFLLCVDAPNDPAIEELGRSFASLETGQAPERVECRNARLVVEDVSANCLDLTNPCRLPEFIDGTPVIVRDAPADRVLVVTELHLDSHVETTREQHSTGGGGGGAGGGGRGRRGGAAPGKSSTTTTTSYVDSPGRSGVIFIFDPRAGRIVGATTVSKASPRDLAKEFARLARAGR